MSCRQPTPSWFFPACSAEPCSTEEGAPVKKKENMRQKELSLHADIREKKFGEGGRQITDSPSETAGSCGPRWAIRDWSFRGFVLPRRNTSIYSYLLVEEEINTLQNFRITVAKTLVGGLGFRWGFILLKNFQVITGIKREPECFVSFYQHSWLLNCVAFSWSSAQTQPMQKDISLDKHTLLPQGTHAEGKHVNHLKSITPKAQTIQSYQHCLIKFSRRLQIHEDK